MNSGKDQEVYRLKRELQEAEGVMLDMRRAIDETESESILIQKQLQEDVLHHKKEIIKM